MKPSKHHLIAAFLLVVLPAAAQEDPQIAFAKERFQAIAARNTAEIEGLYLSSDEVLELTRHVAGLPNREQQDMIEDIRQNNETRRKKYAQEYYEFTKALFLYKSINDSIDWSGAEIDSVTYRYKILVPDGRDEIIEWPQVTSFAIPTDRFVYNETSIYFRDGDKRYQVDMSFLRCNDRWRLYQSAKKPYPHAVKKK